MKKLRLLLVCLFIIGLITAPTMFGANTGDFQSAGSGNWGTLATWQTWNGTSWVAATSIPDSNITTGLLVTVLSGHNVTVAATIGVSNVTINSGGTVTVTAPAVLYITKSGMTVNGSLIIGGNAPTATPYTVTVTSGVLTVGGTGTVYYDQGAAATATKGALPNATWQTGSTLQVDSTGGATAASFGAGGGQNFYNLIWNVTNSSANFGLSLYTNTIGGNVSVLKTGTGRLQFFGSNPGTLKILGNLIVSGAANVTSQGSSTANINDTIFVYGKVNVSTTGNFSVARGSQGGATGGTSTSIWNFLGDSVKIIAATMQNSDTGSSVAKFVFKKSGTQYLSISTTTASGNAFPIEVDAGTTVSLASPVNVTTLYLNGGIINSSASNPLIMGWWTGTTLTSGTISPTAPGSSTSYVNGPMAYLVAAAGSTTKTYAIGKGGAYRPVKLSLNQSAATLSTYTAEMFSAAPPSYTLPGTLSSVSSVRYYKISETAGGSAFTAGSVLLNYDTDDLVNNAAVLRVAKDDGSGNWVDLGGSGSADNTGTITSATAFTTLSNNYFVLAKSERVLTLKALIEALYVAGGTAMPITPDVTVELHNATSPYTLVESQTGTLSTAGVGTFSFATAVNGTNYYIVVKSMNTVEIWSATAVSFTGGALSYDFTTALNKAYTDGSADPMSLHGGKYCIYSGDLNQDGFVSGDD
ncbi:MAG: hypothetical protein P4L27_02905, partial [Ignavibacteriaceae bacterium]|nr:hypothetical protein [Ignavibacteriaceae bacterium]